MRSSNPINGIITLIGRRPARVAAVALLSIGGLAATTGSASAIALLNGSSLSVNGLNISVANCMLTLGGVNQPDCAAGNLEIVSDTGPGASIRIQGVGGGNIFSAALGSGLYDVSFTLNISAVLPGTTVSEARLGMTGSATGTPAGPVVIGGLVSVGENVVGTSNDGNMNVNLAGGPTTASRTFAPITTFSVMKDLKLNAAVPGSGTLTLAYVTQSYLPAPEPAAIGLMLTGLAGLAASRRRKSRRTN